jgi:hypothetical protein
MAFSDSMDKAMADYVHRMKIGGVFRCFARPDPIRNPVIEPNRCLPEHIALTQSAFIQRSRCFCQTGCKHKTHTASQGYAGINKGASQVAPGLFNHGRSRRFVPHLRSTLYCYASFDEVYHREPIVNCILRNGGSMEDVVVALAGERNAIIKRLEGAESIAPKKIRLPDGKVMIWRCPDELVPFSGHNV